MMALNKKLNPDSITLGDVQKMSANEFRQWNFFRLNSINDKLDDHNRRFDKLDNRLWAVLGSAVFLGTVAILAAVL